MPHSVRLVLVHVVWATAKRRHLLPPPFDASLGSILVEVARGETLIAVGCASDHVHVALQLGPTSALADVVQRLKGASARHINMHKLIPDILSWQPGYWAESFGPAALDPLRAYLASQRRHHDDAHPAERWQLEHDALSDSR